MNQHGPATSFPPSIGPVRDVLAVVNERHTLDWVWFLRHASKAPGSPFLTLEENRSRGLSPEGFEEAGRLGRALVNPPEIVLTSPVVRAVETARAIAQRCATAPRVVEDEALLGGRFHDHGRWLDLKREIGWEALVRNWIEGRVPQEIISPPGDSTRAVLDLLRRQVERSTARRVMVVTQGYVNTAMFACLYHRLDLGGGSLYGFAVTMPCMDEMSPVAGVS